jgi:solute:Na+ symporter, SSS family
MANPIDIGWIDYSAIVLFFVMMVTIGFYYFFKTKNTTDYFAGGRIIPGWISGVSYFMSGFSVMVFVGEASVAYRHAGWVMANAPLWALGLFLSAPIAARWHRAGVTTVPEFLSQRFGESTRYLFSFVGIPSRLLDNGNRIYATSVFVGIGLGIGKGLGLWGSSFIIVLYTFLGGLWAVISTDLIQFFLMSFAVLIVSVIGLASLGGFSAFMTNSAEGFWSLSPDSEFTFGYLIAIALLNFINNNGFWSLIQRYTSTPTEWEAKKVCYISALATLVVLPILFLPGAMAPQIISEEINNLVAGGLPIHLAAERSYVLVCLKLLPAGLLGFIIVAGFSATMSALSSEYNILSAVCTKDIYQDLLKKSKKITEQKLLWVGRFSTLGIAILCTIIGSQIENWGGAFKFCYMALGLTSSPTYLPPLLGIYFKRTPAWGANLAFGVGLTSGLITQFWLNLPLLDTVLYNSGITIFTFFLAGFLDPVKGERKKVVESLFIKLTTKSDSRVKSTTGPAEQIGKKDIPNINGVIGFGCAIFGAFLLIAGIITLPNGGFWPNILSAIGLIGIGAVLLYKPSNR